MKIQIEKGIPLINSKGNNFGYPFDEMEVGDSFALKVKEGEDAAFLLRRVSSAKSYYQSKFNPTRKYIARNMKTEIRVWRTK